MNISIIGRPISKKNSRRNYGKVSLPSVAYVKFEKLALVQIETAIKIDKLKQIKGNVIILYKFFMKGKLDSDCDNMIAGINDILQKSGLIENDKFITEGWFKKISNNKDWRTEIKIEKA